MNHPETKRLAAMATGKHENLDLIWKMVHSGDRETSINALWAITHLIKSDSEWLQSLPDETINTGVIPYAPISSTSVCRK